MEYIQREITPIGEEDLFIVLNHPHAKFDYAAHFHSDYEINMVINGKGKRILGEFGFHTAHFLDRKSVV